MCIRLACSVLQFLKRYSKPIWLCILAVLVLTIAPIVVAKIYQNWDRDPDRGAVAIDGGAYGESYSTPRYLEQGWTRANSLWFYNTTQGSALLPYDFFLVLKQANSDELFRSDKNIDRFRYLPQKKTFFNPDALPVGFVKDTYEGKDYVGYTCAACHTGQVNYNGQALRIDGGPAMADMVGFLTELETALAAAQSGDKQKNFVDDVLKLKNDYSSATAVTDDLEKWKNTLYLYNAVNHSEVKYGHARLDAFGRIFNRTVQHAVSKDQVAEKMALVVVTRGTEKKRLLTQDQIDKVLEGVGKRIVLNDDDFSLIVRRLQSKDPGYPGLDVKDLLYVRDQIFNPPDAPVSYPFLWDIAHSDYVQWNGLADNAGAGPLGRNAGEVIGVFGILDWGKDTSWFGLHAWLKKFSFAALASGQRNKKEIIEFDSSINLFNLQRLESQLADLKSPQWPFCRNGKGEYYLPAGAKNPISPTDAGYCSGTDTRFDEASRQRGELLYIDRCQSCHTVVDRSAWDRIVVGNMESIRKIGTDPAMATNSVNDHGGSGNFKDTYQSVSVGELVVQADAPVIQILTAATKGVVATPDAGKWYPRRMVEWIYTLVASLGDNSIKKSSVKNGDYDPDTTSTPYASLLSYRARSLNGIWATAPYLHNGSVPTLWDLLLPAGQRPHSFKVGAREFDPAKVGFKSDGYDGFEFNTSQPGNLNTGHDKYGPLSDQDRWDLIEYLKSL
jgi:hypothetical protein